jgi:predicted dehydrogenase
MRLGLVGRGRWGRNIERTLHAFADVTVVAIGRGERPPAALDGVLIASPSDTHADLAVPWIEAGLPTFIEKPMATRLEDADRIGQAAHRGGGLVFVGHVQRHNPAFQALLDALPALGAIRYVVSESANGRPRAGSSVLWDWLPHDLSMARAIFGAEPDDVQAWPLADIRPPQAAVTRYRYGATSLVAMSSWLSPVRQQRMTITAERGSLVFDDRAEPKLVLHRGEDTSYLAYDDELPLICELRAFVDAVRLGRADPAQLADGLADVQAIVAAEASLAGGGGVVPISGSDLRGARRSQRGVRA